MLWRLLAAVLVVGCGGRAFDNPHDRTRIDGKIPVSIDLIRQQAAAELDGKPPEQAEAERWQMIERDFNDCRLSSAKDDKDLAKEIFDTCMSDKGYVYMNRIRAEELHDSIADKVYEERQVAARRDARRAEEQRQAAEIAKHIKSKTLEWVLAINEKDLDKMRALGAENVDVNAAGVKGRTALHIAAFANDIEFVKSLIAAGANVNAVDNYGYTTLLLAAFYGHAEVAKMLIAAGANVNLASNVGNTALHVAAYYEDAEVAAEVVKMLIAAGANVNAASNKGVPVLHVAATYGNAEVVKVLIAAGANVNAANNYGATALYVATEQGHAEVVRILKAAGANVNAEEERQAAARVAEEQRQAAEEAKRKAEEQRQADAIKAESERLENNLRVYAREGKLSEVRRLIADGVNVNAADNNGGTALHYAAIFGQSEVAKVLIAAGVNVNAAGENRVVALHFAINNRNIEIVKALIAAGANVNVADIEGWTALLLAVKYGYTEVVKVLIAAGANVNAAIADATALNLAVANGHAKVAKVLLECGASPDIRGKTGFNAWDLASHQPLVNVVFQRFYEEAKQGRTYPPCRKSISQQSAPVVVAEVAKPTTTANIAAQVFDNTWRSVVVIENGDNLGSGVIVRPNVVATNCHVVDEGGDIIVYKADEQKAATNFYATIRHADNARDFCLLDVAGLWGIAATVRKYNTLKVGEDVYNLGAPEGLDLSLSSGIISQLREFDGQRWIQTDAAISPGSSGGGMFDSEGNLIGITTQKLVSEDAEGIGFAIPADLILEL